jgi:hypothetical protein
MISYEDPTHQEYLIKREPFRLLKAYFESFGISMSDDEFFNSIALNPERIDIRYTDGKEILRKMDDEKLNMKHLLETKAITQNQYSAALKLLQVYLASINQ